MLDKSTFRIDPRARVEDIRLCYNVPLTLDDAGGLRWGFPQGEFRESAPVAWQEKNGNRIPVTVSYRLREEREAGFSVGGYDPAYPLVIDPNLTWNTFLGGWGSFIAEGLALDNSGNVSVTGYSSSGLARYKPKRPYSGNGDPFVAKLDKFFNRSLPLLFTQ
jgi:hypothetical protein